MIPVAEEKKAPDVVLWIDPGLHLGWAMLEGEHFSTGQVHGRLEAGDFLHETISSRPGIACGWEIYIVGHGVGGVGDPAPAHENIGVARWLTHHHGGTVLLGQPAASRTIASMAALKGMGWEWKGNHSLSATQHLLAWCLREKHLKAKTDEVYGALITNLDRMRTGGK